MGDGAWWNVLSVGVILFNQRYAAAAFASNFIDLLRYSVFETIQYICSFEILYILPKVCISFWFEGHSLLSSHSLNDTQKHYNMYACICRCRPIIMQSLTVLLKTVRKGGSHFFFISNCYLYGRWQYVKHTNTHALYNIRTLMLKFERFRGRF